MNLFLIGYRGSGKSTVAPLIAELANCDWVDTDELVELAAETSIAQIFAESGESEFRRLETEAIDAVSGKPNAPSDRMVISLGGGAATIQANRDIIKARGKAVYLRGTVDTLWQRINTDPVSGQQRPNLTDQGGRAEVESVLAARQSIYESTSDWQIDIDSISPSEAAEKIYSWWTDE